MTAPPHIALTLLELRAKRDFIDKAISVLAQIWEGETEPRPQVPAVATEVGNGHVGKKARRSTPKPERRSAPRKLTDDDSAVVRAIRKAGGVIGPGALALALRSSKYALKQQTERLVESGQIVVTGVTAGRRFSLPGKQPAKEAP